MLKNSIDIRRKHERFKEETLISLEVWTLKNDNGYVSSSSNHYEDDKEQPLLVQVFWSNPKEAKVCSRSVWESENFVLDSIPLAEFIEFWCIGMHNDDIIVGTNYDHQLFGHEENPLFVAKELLEKLLSHDIKVDFQNYFSIEELLNTIEPHLADLS